MRNRVLRRGLASVKDMARIARETCSLRRVPRQAADSITLPGSETISFPRLFGDDIADEWEAENRAIGDVFDYADVKGAVFPGERRALWYLVRRFEPRSVLEIGTHIGGSMLYIARALKACRPVGALPRLVTVDRNDVNDGAASWARYGLSASPRDMLARLDCADVVEFVVDSSLDYLTGCEDEFDFIFLDGSHRTRVVYREIPLALRALRPNGCLLLHDYCPDMKPVWRDGKVLPGPWLAVERLRREGAGLVALPLGALPWPTKPGSNATCLALLARE